MGKKDKSNTEDPSNDVQASKSLFLRGVPKSENERKHAPQGEGSATEYSDEDQDDHISFGAVQDSCELAKSRKSKAKVIDTKAKTSSISIDGVESSNESRDPAENPSPSTPLKDHDTHYAIVSKALAKFNTLVRAQYVAFILSNPSQDISCDDFVAEAYKFQSTKKSKIGVAKDNDEAENETDPFSLKEQHLEVIFKAWIKFQHLLRWHFTAMKSEHPGQDLDYEDFKKALEKFHLINMDSYKDDEEAEEEPESLNDKGFSDQVYTSNEEGEDEDEEEDESANDILVSSPVSLDDRSSVHVGFMAQCHDVQPKLEEGEYEMEIATRGSNAVDVSALPAQSHPSLVLDISCPHYASGGSTILHFAKKNETRVDDHSSRRLRFGNALDECKVCRPTTKFSQSGGPLGVDPCVSLNTNLDSNNFDQLVCESWDSFKSKIAACKPKITAEIVNSNEPLFLTCESKIDACKSIITADSLNGIIHLAGVSNLEAGPSTLSIVAAPYVEDMVYLTNKSAKDNGLGPRFVPHAPCNILCERSSSPTRVAAARFEVIGQDFEDTECGPHVTTKPKADFGGSFNDTHVDKSNCAVGSFVSAEVLPKPSFTAGVSNRVAAPSIVEPLDSLQLAAGYRHGTAATNFTQTHVGIVSCGTGIVPPSQATIREATIDIKGCGAEILVDPSFPNPSFDAPTKPKWASLFNSNDNEIENEYDFKLDHIDLSEFRKERLLKVPNTISNQGSREWQNTIVGFFLDRRLPYSLVHNASSKFWEKTGLINTLATDQGTFFFQFDSAAAVEGVLEGGPWTVAGKPLILRKWSPQLSIEKHKVSKVPVWVCFYNVPLELWNQKGLSYIASMIGKPIQVDRMTANRRRITYARVCIEVDAKDDWITSFDLEAENSLDGSVPITIRVEYQWTPSRCKVCKCFGHDCNKKPPAPLPSARPIPSQQWHPSHKGQPNPNLKVEPQHEASDDGLWTEVVRKGKSKAITTKEQEEPAVMSSSPSSSRHDIIISNSFNSLIPFVYDTKAPLSNKCMSQSVILDDPTNCTLEILGGDTMNEDLSEDSKGKSVVSQVVKRKNSIRDLPTEDEVGGAMNLNEAVQGFSIDSDCIEDLDEHRDVHARDSIDIDCPSSSRQKKKEAKKKFSGSRPKGRHKA